MAFSKVSVICLMVVCMGAYVTAKGYGGGGAMHYGYYRQPAVQYYYQPGRYYAVGTGAAGYGAAQAGAGLSGGLSDSGGQALGSIIPLLVIFLAFGILAPSLIASLTSVNQGANNILQSSG